jgi:hypothetical protein
MSAEKSRLGPRQNETAFGTPANFVKRTQTRVASSIPIVLTSSKFRGINRIEADSVKNDASRSPTDRKAVRDNPS